MARLFADENFAVGIIACTVDLDFAGQFGSTPRADMRLIGGQGRT
jgi:hypothetical protein